MNFLSSSDSHLHLLYYISKSSSIISLSIWLFAQIPQIILNHHQQEVTLSILFITLVSISDLINLGYQIVIKNQAYSILLLYSSILNLVVISQYFYYLKYPKRSSSSSSTTNTNSTITLQTETEAPTLVNRILGSALMASTALSLPINNNNDSNNINININVSNLIDSSNIIHPDLRKSLLISSSVLYTILRIPQIRKNYNRKSTSGVSIYMIILTLLGNIFNAISIISDPHLFKIYSHDSFLIGSLGTIFMDLIILFQFWKYKKLTNPLSTHAHAHENDYLLRNQFISIDEHPHWYMKNQPLVLYQQDLQSKQTNSSHLGDGKNNSFSDYITTTTSTTNTPPAPHPPVIGGGGGDNLSFARGRKLIKSPGNQTSLLSDSLNQLLTPPPQHYIVSSSLRYQQIMNSSGGGNGNNNQVPKAIPKSLTSSSIGSATSFIPSIIGNISSVNKKLLDGSKVPFLPIDFLADEFFTKSPNLTKDNDDENNNHNNGSTVGRAYYGSVDV